MKLKHKFIAVAAALAMMGSSANIVADDCCYDDCGSCYDECSTLCNYAPAIAIGAIAVVAIVAVALTDSHSHNHHSHSHM